MRPQEDEFFPALGEYAGEILVRKAGVEAELLGRVAAGLMRALAEGAVCLPLDSLGNPDELRTRLSTLGIVGGPGDEKPLVIDGPDIYLQRYHAYECALAARLLALAGVEHTVPSAVDGELARILSRGLGIITGGPGTGKTSIARRILALLAPPDRPLSVMLAAPTGKAAARLRESVEPLLADRPLLQLAHGTVHRLLGPKAESAFFRHDARNPLACDVLVLDEASMMDLPLMAKLLDAVDPAGTRLLILGDPGQLPSVHCGSVLADIVAAGEGGGLLAECQLRLLFNHRSGEEPRLAALIDAVRIGDADTVLALLRGAGQLALVPSPGPQDMPAFVERELGGLMDSLHRCEAGAAQALELAASRRVVCMLRQGPCGAESVNALALRLARQRAYYRQDARFFHGMPLIVTRNCHRQNLFNGDSGVVFEREGQLSAFFAPDDEQGLPLRLLPQYEPAFAITVHKGQGSEYRDVTILLPPVDHALLTRELFYTAVSRARRSVRVAGGAELVRLALGRTLRRASGLARRLSVAG